MLKGCKPLLMGKALNNKAHPEEGLPCWAVGKSPAVLIAPEKKRGAKCDDWPS
jgi:hypothetical protein